MDERSAADGEEAAVCPHFQHAAELVGKRWVPQLVRALQADVSRFSDLRTAIPPISDHVLSLRLKELEAAGIVVRTVTPTTPVGIAYRLTDRGRGLAKVMTELAAWAEQAAP
ncbi:MAG TPA: helix-turn-helix domain-containing protein [Actinomycetota bacterium]